MYLPHTYEKNLSLSLSLFSFSLSLQSSLSGCLTTFSHCISVYVCVCARAHTLLSRRSMHASMHSLCVYRPMYIREYGEKYVARIYATKYEQYVTYIAPEYQLFTKLISPLSELLITTKLHVQFFSLTNLPMISASFLTR